MSTTLTYGLKKPVDGDDSASWMDDYEDNLDLLDSHNHNGTNSAQLSSAAIAKESVEAVVVGDWTGGSAGAWTLGSQITVPTAFQSALTHSAELCQVVIYEDDDATNSYNERIYPKVTFNGALGSMTIQIEITTKTALKVLFI